MAEQHPHEKVDFTVDTTILAARTERKRPVVVWVLFFTLAILFLGLLLHTLELSRTVAELTRRLDQNEHWRTELVRNISPGIVHVVTKEGNGTGLVLAAAEGQALILTNFHVISNEETELIAGALQLRLEDNSPLFCKVAAIPRDPEVDLALLLAQDPEGRLRALSIGSFDHDEIGEEVAAVGHPFDLDYSLTSGIISARRDNLYIQHTAQINPGNSGGPLFNREGDVIGVNTSFASGDDDEPLNGGINFATRSDYIFYGLWEYRTDINHLLALLTKPR